MTTVAFDTLKFANRLKSAGIPPQHAEAEAQALAEVFEAQKDELATKTDMRELELRLEAKIEAAKADIIKWLAGLLLAQAGLIAALVKLL